MPKKKSAVSLNHQVREYPLRNRLQKNEDDEVKRDGTQSLVKLEDVESVPVRDPGHMRLMITDAAVDSQHASDIAAKLGNLGAVLADSISSQL